MPLNPMTGAPRAVIGDDLPYDTVIYREVPAGFRIGDLVTDAEDPQQWQVMDPARYPLTAAVWDRLTAEADLVFAEHEIVGRTIADFRDGLARAWAMNGDTFERLLTVYDDDIANPILGRTEIVTYGTPGHPVTITDTHTDTERRKTKADHVDVPVDGSEGVPTYTDGAESWVQSGTVTDKHEHTGQVKTELSDLGVRPNYESLNGFLDNNRTALKVFTDIFAGCFTLHRSMTW